MAKYKVEFSNEAWTQIEFQIRYIATEKTAPINASRWTARLLAAIDKLEYSPRRNIVDQRQTKIHGTTVYRMVFERTYLVFYAGAS